MAGETKGETFDEESLAMAICPDPDNDPRNDRRAAITIRVNGREYHIAERKPGDLAGPNGIITKDTRLALERQFAETGR